MVDERQYQLMQQQLAEAKRKNELMRTVGMELNKVLGLTEKLDNILKILHQQFYINYSMMLLPDDAENVLVVKSSYGYEHSFIGHTLPMGTGIAGMAAMRRMPINITGIRRKRHYIAVNAHIDTGSQPKAPGLCDPESQIAIPLVSNNELVAVLMAESYNLSVFSREDEAFLVTLSQAIAASIQSSILFHNMEDLIAKRTEELQKSNETKDRLFSLISHDLRGPITSFHNIARLVSRYNKQNEREKIDQLSQKIDLSVNKLNTLLNNLLNWALTQTNELHCRLENVNVNALLQEVTGLYSDELLQKEIAINVQCCEDAVALADHNMLTAVLRNLLSNAIKYTPRGGTITFAANKADDMLHITVTDSGIGIDEDKLPLIFEPHERKSTSGTENEKGTGLGLLVVKQFVAMQNGNISIQSKPGNGTIVHVALPAGL